MTTTEARTAVLQALATGELTVDEADERLAALEATAADDRRWGLPPIPPVPPVPPIPPVPPVPPGRGRRRGRLSVDDVILLASHGVDADYLQVLRKAGLGHLGTEDIIRLADHGVDAEWLAAVPAELLGELDIDELVSLADHGVEPQDLEAFLDLRRDSEEQ